MGDAAARAGRVVLLPHPAGLVAEIAGGPPERVGDGGDPAALVVRVAGDAAERVGHLDQVAAPVVGVAGGVPERVGGRDDPARRVPRELAAPVPVGDRDDPPRRVVAVGRGAPAGDAVAGDAAAAVPVEGLDEPGRGDQLDQQPVGIVPQLPALPDAVHPGRQPPAGVVQVARRPAGRRHDRAQAAGRAVGVAGDPAVGPGIGDQPPAPVVAERAGGAVRAVLGDEPAQRVVHEAGDHQPVVDDGGPTARVVGGPGAHPAGVGRHRRAAVDVVLLPPGAACRVGPRRQPRQRVVPEHPLRPVRPR